MCGISGVELMLILVVAVVVLGPERLPDLMRQLGRMMREFRKVTGELTRVGNDLKSQVPIDELRRQLREEMQVERARQVRTDVTSEIDQIRASMRASTPALAADVAATAANVPAPAANVAAPAATSALPEDRATPEAAPSAPPSATTSTPRPPSTRPVLTPENDTGPDPAPPLPTLRTPQHSVARGSNDDSNDGGSQA
jgi:sec-independent protein translocase protein TatB